ncbi:MAG: hypothetical protein ACI92I_000104 [Acidimicrobiales bacterium]|jgi:hypothetical protein
MRHILTALCLMTFSFSQAHAGSVDEEYIWLPKEHTVCMTLTGLEDTVTEVSFADCGTIPYEMRFRVANKTDGNNGFKLLSLEYIFVAITEDGTSIASTEIQVLYSMDPQPTDDTSVSKVFVGTKNINP